MQVVGFLSVLQSEADRHISLVWCCIKVWHGKIQDEEPFHKLK